MPAGFMLYDALGVTEEQADVIAKRTIKEFQAGNNDILELCKVVAEKYDPEAVLVGSIIEQICSANDEFHAMSEKKARRRKFN